MDIHPPPGLCLQAWREELGDDPDRGFILDGITHGFNIVNLHCEVDNVETPNHQSALADKETVGAQILNEVALGNYVITDKKPRIVSALGAIPKSDGGVRIIHDASMPIGSSLNDFAAQEEKLKFQTVDDAVALMTEGCYMAKVDLKAAYRSIPISKDSQQFTGLKWKFGSQTHYMYDTKLPFGARLAPGIFTRITQSVKRMLQRKNINASVVVYLDDFLVLAASFEECLQALNILIALLRRLGLNINWKKVVDPCQQMVFLGVELDSLEMCMRLPWHKLVLLRETLTNFSKLKRASKRQMQSLAGKLNWAAAVVHGGRVFLRRLLNDMNSLKAGRDRMRLSADVKADINWWLSCMNSFNGKALLLDRRICYGATTDACLAGAGAAYQGDWVYCHWQSDAPHLQHMHINHKEVLAIILACYRWAPLWRNKRLVIMSDNQAAVGILNRGTCRDKQVMYWLRGVFHLSVVFNFHVSACYIPGYCNVTADCISRLHEPGRLQQLCALMPHIDTGLLWHHMSLPALEHCRHKLARIPAAAGPHGGLLQGTGVCASNSPDLGLPPEVVPGLLWPG